ncbi:phenol 2-monooxygenase [Microbacterium resistens]|uniref:Phenol 2-monooxygenase n=1 Tax=Microbacterium resistens TaxID=156977 RepID=A0ABU1SDB4_9MICO|nr:FAD-dependent monooxygenase [Microbacterium resistens]MDR6867601.1 phenol 2-monooxygenase [Microbacterium resistens]
MQYYADGFHAGDPTVAPVDPSFPPRDDAPEEVDVLIVGTGPAGLVLAAQLSRFPEITTRIVERRPGALQMGQADGIACRTVEMFEAFDLSAQLLSEAYWVNETVFWRPDPADRGRVVRTGRVKDTEDGLSEFPHVIVNQARVHDYLLEAMRRSPSRLAPDYGLEFVSLDRQDGEEYPLEVRLRRVGTSADDLVTVRARYLIGCDGARSAVRKAIGGVLSGDATNHAWGVLDALAVTDFPDIRLKAAIQSGENGNILLIPREGGFLVRLYVDLGEVTAENRDRLRSMSAAEIAEKAAAVMHPYALEVKEVVWSSVYEVAQRLAGSFDDATDAQGEVARIPRVFIAGDACHTHSAKAGQGMNVSMQDAFNLGWKLASVIRGESRHELLSTYSAERLPVARELIEFDREWSELMAGAPFDPAHPERGGVDPTVLQEHFVRQGRYTAGVATRYRPSLLVNDSRHQHLAEGFEIGTRFHSAPVTRVADARTVELGHVAKADGRWRLYAFAGEDEGGFEEFLRRVEESGLTAPGLTAPGLTAPGLSALGLSGRRGAGALDVRGILQRPHPDVDIDRLPPVLRPRVGALDLVDYEKCFTAATRAGGEDIYRARGIDRRAGAAVLVRPDQYVADVIAFDDPTRLTEFFTRFLVGEDADTTQAPDGAIPTAEHEEIHA